jgi:hypothetical protein
LLRVNQIVQACAVFLTCQLVAQAQILQETGAVGKALAIAAAQAG